MMNQTILHIFTATDINVHHLEFFLHDFVLSSL